MVVNSFNSRDRRSNITRCKAVWRNSGLEQTAVYTDIAMRKKMTDVYNNGPGLSREEKKQPPFFSESSA